MSKLEIIAWLLFASFGGDGGSRSDLSLFIMAGNGSGIAEVVDFEKQKLINR